MHHPPVLKAGHPVSSSSLCMLCVVCLVCIVWFVEVRFVAFFLFFLLLLGQCAIHMVFHIQVYMHVCTSNLIYRPTILGELTAH